MSKYDETFCRKCSAVPIKPSPSSSSSSSSTSTRYRSFNVSKVFSICGILLLTFGYDFNWISSTLVAADKHTYGSIDSNDEVILHRRIIERTSSVPTNYTIIYKYVRNRMGGQISYIEFDVANCVSKGTVQMNHTDDGPRDEQVVSANLHIQNCINLNVTVRFTGHNASVASQLLVDAMLAEVYGDQLFEDKSFALIYAHNETRSMDRIIRIGQRQANDTLLKTEKIHVNNEFTSFPQHEIEYNDVMAFITQTEFIFSSPTASAFLNSSFIEAHQFNAMVYDLNRPEFTVKYNIYGYRSSEKPSHYKPILMS